MSWWTSYWLHIVVGLGGVVAGFAVWFYFPQPEREAALTLLGLVLLVLLPLLPSPGRRSADSQPEDDPTMRFADAVRERWRVAAAQHRLQRGEGQREVPPAPIPISWSFSDLDVAGPPEAAVDAPEFTPLPGCDPFTKAQLQAGGGQSELFALYAGVGSGRVVVVGAQGAGKSGVAIMLLLEALDHRRCLGEEVDRNRTPVPVLLNARGWDPKIPIRDWLISELVATYSVFWHRKGSAEATILVDDGKVALILDGFDEMKEELHSQALGALNGAPFRVVVLSRRPEMEKAARARWFAGAVAVELQEVTARVAADYLVRALGTKQLSDSWTELLRYLRGKREGELAGGFSTPLTLTLLRDIYQPADDFHDVFDATHHPNLETLLQHLFSNFLRAVYTPRQDNDRLRYSVDQADEALKFIARKMGDERHLAWWRIPEWGPTTNHRILVTGFVFGLGGGFVSGLGVWLTSGFVSGLGGFLGGGLVSGFGGGLVSWRVSKLRGGAPQRGEPRRARIANWRETISKERRMRGPVVGHVVGLLKGLLKGFSEGSQRFSIRNKNLRPTRSAEVEQARSAEVEREGLVAGLVGGLVVGLVVGFVGWLRFGLAFGLIAGFMAWFLIGFVFWFIYRLFEGGAHEGHSLSPLEVWRNDRMAGIVGGLASGLMVGVVSTIVGGLVFGFVAGLVSGFLFALAYPEIWPATLAWLQLRNSDHVPVFRFMYFLEDARKRDVLRTVGAFYQFRHPMLQDYLADGKVPASEVQRLS